MFQHKIIITPEIQDQHVQTQKLWSLKIVYFIARLSNMKFERVKLVSLYYYVAADYSQVAILHLSNLQESLKKKKVRPELLVHGIMNSCWWLRCWTCKMPIPERRKRNWDTWVWVSWGLWQQLNTSGIPEVEADLVISLGSIFSQRGKEKCLEVTSFLI